MPRLVEKILNSIPTEWAAPPLTPVAQPSYIYFDAAYGRFVASNESTISDLETLLGVELDIFSHDFLESSNTKYLIPLSHELFHTVHDVLPLILKIYNLDSSSFFLLYKGKDWSNSSETIKNYVEEFLTYKNVNYVILDANTRLSSLGYMTTYSPAGKMCNYVDLSTEPLANDLRLSLNDYLLLSKEIETHVGPHIKPPSRKVYLSRSHLLEARSIEISEEAKKHHKGYINDIRMNDESVLENFFRDSGYEIVIPEKDFTTLHDQIKFMQSVKVLASVTGSGLSNALFMKNGQTVLEISAELVTETHKVSQLLTDHYRHDAFIKEHNYISISSKRDPSEVIDRLKLLVTSGIC